MYLYNSATHTKEEFRTHTPGHVEMYTCGPTVYHFAHIGNLRSYIMEDVLEKYLRYVGYDVNRVMNITDVGHLTSDADEGEDKMLKGARREHKTVMEIAQFYTDAFFEDCRKLNIKRPDVVQPATGLIDDYIRIISRLLEKGYAYVAGGNVYFDTSKLERYYVFNDHNEEDLAVGVREGVEEDVNKRNKNDFVLWFTCSGYIHIRARLAIEGTAHPDVFDIRASLDHVPPDLCIIRDEYAICVPDPVHNLLIRFRNAGIKNNLFSKLLQTLHSPCIQSGRIYHYNFLKHILLY